MNELKKIRESLNITQVEASKMLNISRRSYQKYEALENENDDKLQYYIYKLRELNLIDEEHGILKLDDIKREINNILSKYKINFCYLFGSYAKNKATPLSDIDLLIDSKTSGSKFLSSVSIDVGSEKYLSAIDWGSVKCLFASTFINLH